MVVSKTIQSTNATANIRYILNDTPHIMNETGHRVLALAQHNVDTDYAGNINALYTAAQFNTIRHTTNKYKFSHKDKKTQSEHLIISFSDKDFDLSDPVGQAKQAMTLISDFMTKQLGPNSQWLAAAQDDNLGHKLHIHVVVNSVNVDGKVLDTSRVKQVGQDGFRNHLNNYLEQNFELVTGRKFVPVTPAKRDYTNATSSKERNMKANRSNAHSWKDDLRSIIDNAMSSNIDMQGFKDQLSSNGVTIVEKPHRIGKNEDGTPKKRTSFHYIYVDERNKQHKSVDFAITKKGSIRGLGENYIPDNIQHQLDLNMKKQNELSGKSTEDDLDSIINDIEAGLNDAVSAAVAANEQPKPTESSSASMTSEVPVVASSDEVATSIESVNQRRRRNRQERVTAEFERQDGPHMIMQTVSRTKKPINEEEIAKAQNTQKINHNGPSSSSTSFETSSDLEL